MMKTLALGLLAMSLSASAWAGIEELGPATCGSLNNAFGPFDYRTATQEQHGLVEGAHFTFPVESLKRGKTSTTPGPDIDYTLRVFPNHHRALLAMMNLSLKEKKSRPLGSNYSIDCWMERGERWRPDDEVVKILFGTHLLRTGRRGEARGKLDAADKLIAGKEVYAVGPNVLYNLGLALYQLGDYDRAQFYAHKAYALNYPLPGLRQMLKKAGHWQEASPAAASSEPVSDGLKQGDPAQ
ncbi:tetratricopeptide repeat protein [Niveibacterium terrae]|uniref:tetratricopeptide repeat protein n=1 Tax=Niveibacterium terrae TaxID=3373598 RepID=UPI003A94D487